jgi:hypothetical protein
MTHAFKPINSKPFLDTLIPEDCIYNFTEGKVEKRTKSLHRSAWISLTVLSDGKVINISNTAQIPVGDKKRIEVSTKFVAIDRRLFFKYDTYSEKPLVFETIIEDESGSKIYAHYQTIEDAREGHAATVEEIKKRKGFF